MWQYLRENICVLLASSFTTRSRTKGKQQTTTLQLDHKGPGLDYIYTVNQPATHVTAETHWADPAVIVKRSNYDKLKLLQGLREPPA